MFPQPSFTMRLFHDYSKKKYEEEAKRLNVKVEPFITKEEYNFLDNESWITCF